MPDIGAELTGGCYGFATKYMHWPEEMIVGGVVRNKTGHIVKAKALQSIVQLMGEREMFEFHQQSYKVHNIDWSMDKARIILETWQRKFSWVRFSFFTLRFRLKKPPLFQPIGVAVVYGEHRFCWQ